MRCAPRPFSEGSHPLSQMDVGKCSPCAFGGRLRISACLRVLMVTPGHGGIRGPVDIRRNIYLPVRMRNW